MDLATRLLTTKADIQKVQQCRLFLKAISMSDLIDGSGKYIRPKIWRGSNGKHRSTTLNFPNTGRPSPADWTTFRKFLRQFLQNPDVRRTNQTPLISQLSLRPENQLGPWYKELHERWTTVYSPATQSLYVTEDGYITKYKRGGRTSFRAYPREQVTTTPTDSLPITMTS